MAILTKFLQLLKPERNDYVDVEKHLSENYDKIDTKMEELSNSNDKKLDKGAVSSEYDTAKKIEDKIKTKLNQGNVPDVLNSAEKIIKALQGNTGIKFDENLLYLNDSGTKKKGYCYIDKLTDGIFECIQETTTTVNNATYFKNFSNKENSDRLSNLIKHDVILQNNELKITDIGIGYIIKLFENILITSHSVKTIEYGSIMLKLTEDFGVVPIPSVTVVAGGFGASDLAVTVRPTSLIIYNQNDDNSNDRYTIPTTFFVPKF